MATSDTEQLNDTPTIEAGTGIANDAVMTSVGDGMSFDEVNTATEQASVAEIAELDSAVGAAAQQIQELSAILASLPPDSPQVQEVQAALGDLHSVRSQLATAKMNPTSQNISGALGAFGTIYNSASATASTSTQQSDAQQLSTMSAERAYEALNTTQQHTFGMAGRLNEQFAGYNVQSRAYLTPGIEQSLAMESGGKEALILADVVNGSPELSRMKEEKAQRNEEAIKQLIQEARSRGDNDFVQALEGAANMKDRSIVKHYGIESDLLQYENKEIGYDELKKNVTDKIVTLDMKTAKIALNGFDLMNENEKSHLEDMARDRFGLGENGVVNAGHLQKLSVEMQKNETPNAKHVNDAVYVMQKHGEAGWEKLTDDQKDALAMADYQSKTTFREVALDFKEFTKNLSPEEKKIFAKELAEEIKKGDSKAVEELLQKYNEGAELPDGMKKLMDHKYIDATAVDNVLNDLARGDEAAASMTLARHQGAIGRATAAGLDYTKIDESKIDAFIEKNGNATYYDAYNTDWQPAQSDTNANQNLFTGFDLSMFSPDNVSAWLGENLANDPDAAMSNALVDAVVNSDVPEQTPQATQANSQQNVFDTIDLSGVNLGFANNGTNPIDTPPAELSGLPPGVVNASDIPQRAAANSRQ